MASHTETWCDCCQGDEPCNRSQALALAGNEPDGPWPHGYGPYPVEDLVFDCGWAVFKQKRTTDPIVRDGVTVIDSYEITVYLYVCANCLSDPDFDVQAMYGAGHWTPQDRRSEENYERARQQAEEA